MMTAVIDLTGSF